MSVALVLPVLAAVVAFGVVGAGRWAGGSRLAAMSEVGVPAAVRRSEGRPSSRPLPVTYLGHWCRRALHRPADDIADRCWGWAVLAGSSGWLLSPVVGLTAATVAGAQAARRARIRARRTEFEVVAELPEVVDLFAMAAVSGLNVSLAVQAVAKRSPPRFRAALGEAAARATAGVRLADALDGLVGSLGEHARPLVTVLAAADRYGAPLVPSLERLGLEVRLDRRRRAEEAIRRVPITLLFPLVACVLPAFGLLTVAPLVAGALGGLRP
ncbi:MAG: type II secretion system F family protein [Acidimicrobiia bacterium]